MFVLSTFKDIFLRALVNTGSFMALHIFKYS